jgi:hypothetical protein
MEQQREKRSRHGNQAAKRHYRENVKKGFESPISGNRIEKQKEVRLVVTGYNV